MTTLAIVLEHTSTIKGGYITVRGGRGEGGFHPYLAGLISLEPTAFHGDVRVDGRCQDPAVDITDIPREVVAVPLEER